MKNIVSRLFVLFHPIRVLVALRESCYYEIKSDLGRMNRGTSFGEGQHGVSSCAVAGYRRRSMVCSGLKGTVHGRDALRGNPDSDRSNAADARYTLKIAGSGRDDRTS